MRVFIAGATGVLGRRVVDRLVGNGHQVVGLSRSPANAAWLAAHGAEAREASLFDADGLRQAVGGCDAALHLATAIPNKTRPTPSDWQMNDRLRREGTRHLLDAALANGCRRYIQQSITFIYGHRGDAWVDETATLPTPQPFNLQSAVDMEQMVQEAALRGLPAVILRCGSFYCHDSAQTIAMLNGIRQGRFPVVGDGRAWWSPLHVDDAASAVVRALEHKGDAAGSVYNVCDDEPVMYGALMDYMAQTLSARRPRRVPPFLARLLVGSGTVDFLLTSTRCKNDRIKRELGWQPQYPTYREGVQATVAAWLKGMAA